MNILKPTDKIRKNNCLVQLSEQQQQHMHICMVECTGKSNKNSWSHLYYSTNKSYAMLWDKQLIDLPGKTFLVHQINEHSKGGHTEYEFQLMNLQGNVLNKFAGKYHSDFLLDGKYLWFLNSENNSQSLICNKDLYLIKLDFKTGILKQKINLNYSELLECPTPIVLSVKFIEKRNDFFLHINYIDTLKYNHKKKIPLSIF